MACKGTKSRLFLTDSAGRIVSRRDGVWSTNFDRCQGCGTTDSPHEARGLCHRCYVAYRYRNNVKGVADRNRARLKAIRLTDEGEAKERAHDAARKADPRQRELVRQTKLRWAKKNAKFAPGTPIEYEIIPGQWVKGTVLDNAQDKALVQFTTYQDLIPHRHLKKTSSQPPELPR